MYHRKLGKEKALEIRPFKIKEQILIHLGTNSEYVLASYTNDTECLTMVLMLFIKELKLLKIDKCTIELSGLKNKIGSLCTTVKYAKKFLKKFKDYLPFTFEASEAVKLNLAFQRISMP